MEQKRGSRGTALVTGASSGIGLELAKVLAREGHDLVLVARRKERLEDLALELKRTNGIGVRVHALDLAEAGAAESLKEGLGSEGATVEILVNNAGVALYGPFTNTSLSQELEMIQLNVSALTQLTKVFVPDMVKRGHGAILNVASTAAFVPGPLMAVYYATKAYVLSFSQALAAELEGTGVKVTALCPGPTRTNLSAVPGLGESRLFRRGVMDAPEVAEAGYRGLMAGRRIVIPGARNRFLMGLAKVLPRGIVLQASKRMVQRA